MKPNQVELKSLKIEGFRSCEKTSVNFNSPLSVLIGPNGSGKTNILQALILLGAPFSRPRFYRNRNAARSQSQCRILAGFRVGNEDVVLRSTLSYSFDEDNKEVVIDSNEEWRTGDIADRKVPLKRWHHLPREWTFRHLAGRQVLTSFTSVAGQMTLFSGAVKPSKYLKTLPKMLRNTIPSIMEFRSRITYYSAAQFTNPARCPSSIEIDAEEDLVNPGSTRHEHQRFIRDLYIFRQSNPLRYRAYVSIVSTTGLGLVSRIHWKQVKVAASQIEVGTGGNVVKRDRQRLLIVPSVQIGTQRLSFSQLSEGTFKTLALIFYLMTDNSDLLLIEEPEVCVHHGLLASIIELIKGQSAEKQIIFSTHSDFILDKLQPEQVLIVARSQVNGTRVKSLTGGPKQPIQALRRFLQTAGNLGELWRQGGFDN